MTILIDSRELQIIEECNKMGEIGTKQLPIGDIIITNNTDNLCVIIERKTWNDLYSSIISNRFSEQRERLKEFRVNNKGDNGGKNIVVIYLVEGTCNVKYKKITTGAIENLILFHNISVIYSKSVQDSVDQLFRMDKKVQVYSTNGINGCGVSGVVEIKYTERKTKIIENMLFYHLTLIPGVSAKIANAITLKYPTVQVLLEEFKTCSREDGINLCSDILIGPSGTGNGNSNRRVGKSISEKIYNTYN